jgi:hypothetical protein
MRACQWLIFVALVWVAGAGCSDDETTAQPVPVPGDASTDGPRDGADNDAPDGSETSARGDAVGEAAPSDARKGE